MLMPTDGLAAIQSMDRRELLAAWEQRFDSLPPRRASLKLLQSVLSWEEQAQHGGGLPPEVSRQLRDRSKQLFADNRPDAVSCKKASDNKFDQRKAKPMLRPGVQLMREWNGRTYRVEVTEDGFILDGKTYRSLKAIARRITCAHWSGPRFFGLTDRRRSPRGIRVSAA